MVYALGLLKMSKGDVLEMNNQKLTDEELQLIVKFTKLVKAGSTDEN